MTKEKNAMNRTHPEMKQADLDRIMQQIPNLTAFGIGTYEGEKLQPAEKKADFDQDREQLRGSLSGCEKTCAWLRQIDPTKAINRRQTSYTLKHIAEKKIGYIPNGVFIAAAIYLGFPFKLIQNSPNVFFGMSEASIRRMSQT